MPTKDVGIKIHLLGEDIPNANILDLATMYGEVAGIEWCYEHGYTGNFQTSQLAAKCGKVEAMKRLRAHDCPWDEGSCYEASMQGKMPMLRYMLKEAKPPCRVDFMATYSAAEGG
jgi:hypothetical protein